MRKRGSGLCYVLELMILLTLSMTSGFINPEANVWLIKLLEQKHDVEGIRNIVLVIKTSLF
jgi:hypothetical protein